MLMINFILQSVGAILIFFTVLFTFSLCDIGHRNRGNFRHDLPSTCGFLLAIMLSLLFLIICPSIPEIYEDL